jgi:hypothetical protein
VGERKAAGGVPASTGIATATPPGALKRFGPTAEPVSKGCAGPAKPVAMLWWLMSTGERAGNCHQVGSPKELDGAFVEVNALASVDGEIPW